MTPRFALAALLLTPALAQKPAEDPVSKIMAEFRTNVETLGASFVAAMAAANSDKVERLLVEGSTTSAEELRAAMEDLDKTLSTLARFDLDYEGLVARTEMAFRKVDPELEKVFQTTIGEPRKFQRRAHAARMGYYRELRELYAWLFTTQGAWTKNQGQFTFRDKAGVERYNAALEKLKAREEERQAALREIQDLQNLQQAQKR